MSDVKYDIDREEKLPDLEVLRLRQELVEARKQLEAAQAVLEENGLSDAKPKEMTPHEKICHQQISKLAELSNKGIPFTIEDIKALEILVKTLLAIQGKGISEEVVNAKKKKNKAPSVADLLSIVKNNPKDNV